MSSATKDPITFQAKDFPKLHGQENYQIWANAWEVAFTMMEVWDVINGEKPETPAEGSSSDVCSSDLERRLLVGRRLL